MQLVAGSERIVGDGADPVVGRIRWSPAKSLWIGVMTTTALIAAPLSFTWGAFALFLFTTTVTLCAGHSVGIKELMGLD